MTAETEENQPLNLIIQNLLKHGGKAMVPYRVHLHYSPISSTAGTFTIGGQPCFPTAREVGRITSVLTGLGYTMGKPILNCRQIKAGRQWSIIKFKVQGNDQPHP